MSGPPNRSLPASVSTESLFNKSAVLPSSRDFVTLTAVMNVRAAGGASGPVSENVPPIRIISALC